MDSRYLVDNAILGSSLASIIFKIDNPSVGLLNIGTEDIKGNEEIKLASDKLKELTSKLVINFQGYVEGNDISHGKTNVVVTDGFTGNIALKTAEGTAKLFKVIYLMPSKFFDIETWIFFSFFSYKVST